MRVDVINRVNYLVHGKSAFKGSGFTGVVTSESFLGYKDYTARKKSKELHADGFNVMNHISLDINAAREVDQHQSNFFSYTTKRFGATSTYTSDGWIKTKEDNQSFKEKVRKSFNEDGKVVYVGVISLRDYMTASEFKMYDEKDYAAVFEKILPKFFKHAGFENDNMLYWVDHHINTDNPHVHFQFLEIEQTKLEGFLKNSSINKLKTMFWNEVFGKQRFLEQKGLSIKEALQDKDQMKRDLLKDFRKSIESQESEIDDLIKSLAVRLPYDGRLQYGSSNMIPFRNELDEIVDKLLMSDNINDKYVPFLNAVSEFDYVKNQSLNTKDESFYKQETGKLKKQLANMILNEIKQDRERFISNKQEQFEHIQKVIDPSLSSIDGSSSATTQGDELQKDKLLVLGNSLIKDGPGENKMIRIPGTATHVLVDNKNVILIRDKNYAFVVVPANQEYEMYDRDGMSQEEIHFNKKSNIVIEGDTLTAKDIDDLFNSNGRLLSDQQIEKLLEPSNEKTKSDYEHHVMNSKNYAPLDNIKKQGFHYVHDAEQEAKKAVEEYYQGRELDY